MSNRIHDAFGAVHADRQLKENTKEYLFENVYAKKKRRPPHPMRYAAAVCCVLLVFVFGSAGVYNIPVATISVDVNPSVEMKVNLLDRVVDIICFNSEAEKIASGLSLKNMKYEEAVTTLLDSEKDAGYLGSDSAVDISVSGNSESRCSKISETINNCTSEGYGSVHCSHATEEEVSGAEEAGLSVGKYRAYLELKELDPDITVEDIQNMSMRQIRDRIDALSSGTETTSSGGQDSNSNSNSNGNKNGVAVSQSSTGHHNSEHGSGNGSGNGKHSSNGKGANAKH